MLTFMLPPKGMGDGGTALLHQWVIVSAPAQTPPPPHFFMIWDNNNNNKKKTKQLNWR